jgi:hypothetical protein
VSLRPQAARIRKGNNDFSGFPDRPGLTLRR